MFEQEFLEEAIQEAIKNVESNHGGPFGAIVVKNGEIIGRGSNVVTTTNDPSAHAEIQAIRDACRYLNHFQLEDCEIYSSCEPCPMCIGAIYWARPKAVYYACSKEDAAKIGFDDKFIYEQLALPTEQRQIAMKQLTIPQASIPFKLWGSSTTKINY